MSSAVIKLIVVVDEDTAGMITDHAMLTCKERERVEPIVEFTFNDKYGVAHQLHFVHAEEV
ncbi:MAG TPA: hypothetical protein VNS88_04265 [Nitrospiraceae bacterium]|nr:hypothetical protein [Nitrospiraceae bacterium]